MLSQSSRAAAGGHGQVTKSPPFQGAKGFSMLSSPEFMNMGVGMEVRRKSQHNPAHPGSPLPTQAQIPMRCTDSTWGHWRLSSSLQSALAAGLVWCELCKATGESGQPSHQPRPTNPSHYHSPPSHHASLSSPSPLFPANSWTPNSSRCLPEGRGCGSSPPS